MVWSTAVIFCACEFGEQLSETFDQINNSYDQLSWYSFPSNAQHMLIIQLIIAQKPVELRVFGEISCCRITLKNVSKICNFQEEKQIPNSIFSLCLDNQ